MNIVEEAMKKYEGGVGFSEECLRSAIEFAVRRCAEVATHTQCDCAPNDVIGCGICAKYEILEATGLKERVKE